MNCAQDFLLDLLRFDSQAEPSVSSVPSVPSPLLTPSASSAASVSLMSSAPARPSFPGAEDWPAVLDAADRHGLKPYLNHRLRSRPALETVSVPDSVWDDLRKSYLLNVTLNLKRFHFLGVALRALAAAGVPVIVLKGGYLAEAVYDNIALRTMCDIDILVQRESIPAAAEALASAGFDPQEHHLYPPPPDANEYHFFHRQSGCLVELHWEIINPEYPFQLKPDAVWSAAIPARIAGVEVQALSPADLLCHLAVHAGIHSYNVGLRTLVDIAETIRRLSPDWKTLDARARQFLCVRPVWLTLTLARRLLGAAVPDAVLTGLCPSEHSETLVESAANRICLNEEVSAPGNAGNPNLILLFGRKGIWAKVRLAVHRAFPTRAALAALYPVSPKSPLVYLYYFRWINTLIKRNGPAIRAKLLSRRSPVAQASVGGDHPALMDWLIRGE